MWNQLTLMALCSAACAWPAETPRTEAAGLPARLEKITLDARSLKQEGRDMAATLSDAAAFDLAKVQAMMANLERLVVSLDAMVVGLDSFRGSFSPAQHLLYDRMVQKVQLLHLFTANKKDVLSAAAANGENRALLRMRAEAIAGRAERLQQTAARFERH